MELVTVDISELSKLAKDIDTAKRVFLDRLSERGYQVLRIEVPKRTGNLKDGVRPAEKDYEKGEAVLTVTARSARTAGGQAAVIGADGTIKKTVSIRPQPAYNYAEVVARGNRSARLSPTNASAFLIPVNLPPQGESYLVLGGEKFIVRKSRKGTPPNPFDERAARRLESEAPGIGDAVLRQFV